MQLSGITFIHNGVEHDYCFEEAIWSMLAVCSEVVCVEAGSTDATLEKLWAIQTADARLRIIQTEWLPKPLVRETNTDWTKDLADLARNAAVHPMVLYIQADEVLHEKDSAAIKQMAATGKAYLLRRLNFWVDPWHLVPPGRVCGHYVNRLAPKESPVSWGSEHLVAPHAMMSEVDLFHYGFIRDGAAFRKKSEIMHKNFMGVVDPIIYEAEKHGIAHLRHAWPESELLNYNGSHPQVAKNWLGRHGFDV